MKKRDRAWMEQRLLPADEAGEALEGTKMMHGTPESAMKIRTGQEATRAMRSKS
jgi:hypothetical protein